MQNTIGLRALLCGALLLLTVSVATAQPRPDKEYKNWFGHFSGSWVMPQSTAGDVLDDGWKLSGGATYWPEHWPVGLVFDLGYSDMDISSDAIRRINNAIENAGGEGKINSGDYDDWSVSVNATWSPSDNGAGFYIIGGVGVDFVEGRIKQTGLVYYPPVCDPWFWWCYPGGVGPGSIVVGKRSSTEFGVNLGIGWAFRVGLDSQLFIEARYYTIDTSPKSTEMLPITIGYRW